MCTKVHKSKEADMIASVRIWSFCVNLVNDESRFGRICCRKILPLHFLNVS